MIIYRRKKHLSNSDNKANEKKECEMNTSLDNNISMFKNIFKDDETVIYRYFESRNNDSLKGCIVFVEGMINEKVVNDNIILPVVSNTTTLEASGKLEALRKKVLISSNIIKSSDVDELIEAIINGDTVLFIDGDQEALILSSKGWETRPINEPEVEKVLRGPREGFTESIIINLTMIRRKIKTPDLKFKCKTLGVRTKTRACICYVEGIVNEKILEELEKRLAKINIDGVLDTGYIQELIRDAPLSPFRTIGSTERPDVVAGKILEGRIALLLDGSPTALTLPFLFIEYFHAPDDYYINFYFTSISRLLRILSFLLTTSVPGIYLALITFHQEIIPTNLLLSISAARQAVPFPSLIEALGLLLIFEILREAGTRMPTYIGQALSIVGVLVLGTAAVDARFVSAPMVIIIALSGITGLMTPKIKGVAVIMRIGFLLVASFIGLYGIVFAASAIMVHLFNIRSFGVGYMDEFNTLNFQEIKDMLIRFPWWLIKDRPRLASSSNKQRQSKERGTK